MTKPKRVKYCIEFDPKEYHELKIDQLDSGHNSLAKYLRCIIATRKYRE